MSQLLRALSWTEYQARSPEEKVPLLAQPDGSPFHTLFAQQFDRALLDRICTLTNRIRAIAKTRSGSAFLADVLCHRRAMLYFSQPSSRTFLSFCSACQILGLQLGEVRDPSTSSEIKGESREDSVRTFSSYFDMIIMRSSEKGLAERMAWVLSGTERPVPIINAGSGKDQHPTQALLDIYTLIRSFESRGGLRDRRVVFVGDLARGRTVRSLCQLLPHYANVEQVFVAPASLQIGTDIQAQLHARNVCFRCTDDLRSELADADAVYMTRLQDEWDTTDGKPAAFDGARFKLTESDMSLLKPQAILMHPFPRRDEIPAEIDRDPRAMYWRQMRNGMWVRVALIAMTFGCERRVNDYFTESL